MPAGIGYGPTNAPGLRRRAATLYDELTGPALAATFEQAAATTFEPRLAQLRGVQTRRGIRGPLAGALEGDLAASFRRDLLGTAAQFSGERARGISGLAGLETDVEQEGRRFGLAEREFGLAERRQQFVEDEAARERRARRRAGIGRLLGTAAGAGIGFFAGGPAGALTGAKTAHELLG